MAGDSTYQFPIIVTSDLEAESLFKLKNKLIVYFQSKKSGGGECELRSTDCSQGYIIIDFKHASVRDQVLKKQTHELQLPRGQKLTLDVRMPESEGLKDKNASQETTAASSEIKHGLQDKDPAMKDKPSKRTKVVDEDPTTLQVLIENISEKCTLEMLNLLLENATNLYQNQDFYVEMIPEISSAVATFTCRVDIVSVIKMFSGNSRVKNLNLIAKPLEQTKSIRVENLPPNTSEDHLFINFESTNYEVQEVKLVLEEDAAIVTFCDGEVLKILPEKQYLSGNPISVYPFYPSLGVALYGKNIPCVEMPQPLEFPMSPYILEFIEKYADLKKSINEKMAGQHCDIKWPLVVSQNTVITLSFSSGGTTHHRTKAKIVKTWSDQVSTEFSLIISKFKACEFNVNTSVWEAIKDSMHNSMYESVLVKPYINKEKVFLAGFSKDVNKVEPIFKKLLDDITSQIERKHKSIKITVPLAPALYEMMHRNELESDILMACPDLQINYEVSAKRVELYGLKEEVLSAKCDILNKKQELKFKSIHLDPQIRHFLEFADNDEMSCLLLLRHNINAIFQIDGDAVKLTGLTSKDLSQAEAKMCKAIICKYVSVEDKQVTQSAEWKSLTTHINEKFNSEKCTALIVEAENQVVIAGLTSTVEEAYQLLYDFMEKNTPVQKEISTKSTAIMQFCKEENKAVLQEIQKNITFLTKKRSFELSGPKQYVREAAAQIEKVLSLIHFNVLHIKKPGAKKFFVQNEDMYVTTAKNKFNCLIHLLKDGEDDFIDDEINLAEPVFQVTLPEVVIAVYKGDLTRHCVDVLINAANEDLEHIGGLALSLLNAAGPKLQTDCDKIIKKMGKIKVGDSVITDAGNLPCKQVIHTVGPRWNANSQPKCQRLLRNAIQSSLALAAENGHSSIGIPAVSSGIFGFPEDLCVHTIVESVQQFVDRQEKNSIKRIHFVDTRDTIIQCFINVLKDKFGDPIVKVSEKHSIKRRDEKQRPSLGLGKSKANCQMVTTKEGVIIKITEGNIQDSNTDVIVNSVGKDLDLDSGAASKALYQKAGQKLQQLLNEASKGSQVDEGSVYVTGGCALSCNMVIHVVTPHWDNGKGASEKMLRQVIYQCLKITANKNMKSVSFPAIGTGALGFSKRLIASLMFDEILNFSSKNKFQLLQEVNLILHPSDKDSLKDFSDELKNRTKANATEPSKQTNSSSEKGSAFFGNVTSPALGVHEMKIGSIIYQVQTGDITKENTDIIVNSSNGNFTLKTGVSRAILEAAGQGVEYESAQLGSLPHNGYIVTKSGNLLCKHILHVCGRNSPGDIKTCVTESLQECEKLQATSVAFPAFGTGAGGVPSAAVADAMLDGVVDYANSKSTPIVKTVKVVIFQQQMLNDFFTSMQKKEGTNLPKQTSLFSRVTASLMNIFKTTPKEEEELKVFELNENIEPAIFHICGRNKDNVKNASSWLRDLILKEQHENKITDEWIREFEEQDHRKLSDLQKRFQVSISFDSHSCTITVSGLTRDVLEISNQIQKIIKAIRNKKTREREEDLYSNLVEWRYHDGSKFVPFHKSANWELEKAMKEKRLSVNIDISGVKYTVNVERKTASDPLGKTMGIERIAKNELSFELPSNWDQMTNEELKLVQLNSGTQEYTDVQNKFTQTCRMRILKIERIQNQPLWLNYQIKKKSFDTKNGNTNNEQQLFHGTAPDTVKNVNRNGFNRSYAGLNAAAIGNGTYFAVNASYSAHDTYSRPDQKGQKYMYLARVLTGVTTQGRSGMVAPPAKNPNDPTDLYDSVTDNTAQSSMFVIFNDIQAYPEYLITFSK
ncbi:protein mono-ADP-ribosyltransferase PARP14 [Bombina bombina]|uniref:protein mono-ADP-ribosyltransferase PARP14 n=1 Tax=Bombina bombina TaxID=8345 RepID=UPI00235B068F|nr:protein mono-ADP-ribosyltransferase PARP14 [Bombina bombina]